jgi:hypothetical protein
MDYVRERVPLQTSSRSLEKNFKQKRVQTDWVGQAKLDAREAIR